MALVSILINNAVPPILNTIRHMCDDMREPLQQSGIYAVRQSDKHFQDETGPTGHWAALRPLTIKGRRKGKGSGGPKILQDTGRLKMSVVGRGTGHVYRLEKMYLEFGSNLVYSSIHQFGGVISVPAGSVTVRHALKASGKLKKQKSNKNLLVFAKKGKLALERKFERKAYSIHIPARPYLWLSQKDQNNINDIFVRWAKKKINRGTP